MLLDRLDKISQGKLFTQFLLIHPIHQHPPVAIVVALFLWFRGKTLQLLEACEVPLLGDSLGVELVFGNEGVDCGFKGLV
jgi:hypothetical protein